jgi:hypothetical protein
MLVISDSFHLHMALILRQECCINGGMAEYLYGLFYQHIFNDARQPRSLSWYSGML